MKRIALAGLLLLGYFAPQARAADTVYYYHTDALGSPVAVTDANRNVVERTQYGPYGEVLNRPEHDGPGYTGHEEDAQTGLTNMQQRYADKIIGRMDSVDPMGVDPTTGANFNRYAYANDNPYRFTDPDGREGKDKNKPLPPPTTGCLTSGCSASANVSVRQIASPSKSQEQKMKAQANQSGGNSAGDSNGGASQQSSEGSTPPIVPPELPGGPYTPAGGQLPGDFYGPKQPSGPKPFARYVPPGINNPEGYWKVKLPGQKGWQRYDLDLNPRSPEEVHPGNPPRLTRPVEPVTVPWFFKVQVEILLLTYSSPAY